MLKNKFRVTITYAYDIESDKEHCDLLTELEEELNHLTVHILLNKRQIRVEKLKQPKHRIRLGEFSLEDVFPYVSRDDRKHQFTVDQTVYDVRMDSQRYFVFRENNRCVACGLEGVKFYLEKAPTDNVPHFNLYGVQNGRLILMTKDHVQPKAYGGVDIHSNYQTMCAICNNLKGSLNIPLEKVAELSLLFNNNKNLPRKKLRKLIDEARHQFKLPHVESHLPKKNRKTYLAQLKSKENVVVTNLDIRIWKNTEGNLLGKSVYEKPIPNAIEIASIRIGTMLIPLSNEHSKVVVKLENGDLCEIYQGYLEIIQGTG